jgi:hypothetical protein
MFLIQSKIKEGIEMKKMTNAVLIIAGLSSQGLYALNSNMHEIDQPGFKRAHQQKSGENQSKLDLPSAVVIAATAYIKKAVHEFSLEKNTSAPIAFNYDKNALKELSKRRHSYTHCSPEVTLYSEKRCLQDGLEQAPILNTYNSPDSWINQFF